MCPKITTKSQMGDWPSSTSGVRNSFQSAENNAAMLHGQYRTMLLHADDELQHANGGMKMVERQVSLYSHLLFPLDMPYVASMGFDATTQENAELYRNRLALYTPILEAAKQRYATALQEYNRVARMAFATYGVNGVFGRNT